MRSGSSDDRRPRELRRSVADTAGALTGNGQAASARTGSRPRLGNARRACRRSPSRRSRPGDTTCPAGLPHSVGHSPEEAPEQSAPFVALRSSRRERRQDERRRRAPRDSGRACCCWIALRPPRGDLVEARMSSHAASAYVAVPRRGDARATLCLVGGCGSAPGVRVGQVIVKLFFAGVGSAPPALTARTSNVYLAGFSCL
jgi:hypothetical protein